MQLDKNAVSKWLVKSENKVLGPYSFDQVEDLIRKKQISLIDEIRDSYTRWLYVRENPEFKEVVEAIRRELDSKMESTKTYQSFSRTEDFSKTKTDVPAKYTDVQLEVQEASVVNEVMTEAIAETESAVTDDPVKKEKVKLYGLREDAAVQGKLKKTSNQFLVYAAGLFTFALISILGFNYYQKYNQQKQQDQWEQSIKKYKILGLEQKAVEIYGRLNAENQRKLLPSVIDLLPILESNGIMPMSEIDSLKGAKNLTPEQQVNIQLVRYWVSMQTQSYDLAQDYIVKATALMPAPLVKENDAILQLRRGNYQKAIEIYFELYKSETSGRYLFGQAIALMGLPETERSKYMSQISQLIEKYTFVFYDYKKELLLAQLYFAKHEKNDNLFLQTWKQFINTPCQLSALFKRPLLLAPNTYGWKELDSYVQVLRPLLSDEELILLETHHLVESSQISAANQYVSVNSAKIKDNMVKQQLNMLIYHFQSLSPNVLALEKTGQLDMQSELNHVVLALNKIEESANADLSTHLKYFRENKMTFYDDWLSLALLIKQKSPEPLRTFTRNHFLTVNNFLPALEAKSLVE